MPLYQRAVLKVCYAFIAGSVLCGAVLLAGCKDKISSKDSDTGNDAAQAKVRKGVKPVPDAEVAVIEPTPPAP